MSGELTPISEYLPIARTEARRWRIAFALVFAVIALIGLVVGVMWPKKYVASTTILVEESNIIKPLMEGRASTTGIADRAGIAREVIFSRKVMQEILTIGGWLESNPPPEQQEHLIDGIKGRASVASPRDNLIRIEYSDSDPERTFKVTKRMAELFIKESLDSKERESREAYAFIDSQVEAYHQKLSDAEGKLKNYRGGNPDARPGSETDVNARIGTLRTNVENARLELMEMRSKEAALVAQLSGESEITAVQTREGQYRTRLGDLQAELDKLLLTYTDQYPDVVRVRHQMQDVQDELKREEQQRAVRQASGVATVIDDNVRFNPLYQELRSKLAEVRRNIAAAQSRMGASDSLLQGELDRGRRVADSEGALAELTRDYEVNRDIYQDLLKRRENARVSMNLDEEQRGLTFRIQEPAEMPIRPAGLRFMHFGLAGIGLAIALPIAMLVGFVRFDPRARSAGQIERTTGLPVLASIPAYVTRRDRQRDYVRTAILILIIAGVAVAYVLVFSLRLKNVL